MNKNIQKIILGSLSMLLIGSLYAWSVLSMPIRKDMPGISYGRLSIVFTLSMSFFCLAGVLAGYRKVRGKGRYTLISGALLLAAGYILSSQASSAMHLYLGFGILIGSATGLVYNYILSNVSNVIPGKQGLVSGILLFGFGMGSMLIGPVYSKIVTTGILGWRTAFFYFGILLCAFLMIVSTSVPDVMPSRSTSDDEDRSLRTGEMLRTKTFYFYFLWALLLTAIGIAAISQGANIIKVMVPEIDPSVVALSVGMISVANGLGRIMTGLLFDRKGYAFSMTVLVFLMLLGQVLLLGNTALKSFPLLILGFILTGLSYGGCANNNSAFINRIYGSRYYSMNLSLVNLNILPASYASTLSGILFDRFGGYTQTFILTTIGSALGIFLFLAVYRSAGKERPEAHTY